jgi:tetratricopeptide (TPR) repeat protein
MTIPKIKFGRNDKCFCGTGKKNKDCCKLEYVTEEKLFKLLDHAGTESLAQDEARLLRAIDNLERYLTIPGLTNDLKTNVLSILTGAYQRRGFHNKALSLIEQLKKRLNKEDDGWHHLIRLEVTSLTALQEFDKAADLIDNIYKRLLAATDNKSGAAFNLLEAGKTYLLAKSFLKGKACLEKCVELIKDDENNTETLNKAKANLANIMLFGDDENLVVRGLKLLEESVTKKAAVGDMLGVSIDYSNLARYYHSKKNYKSALAYYRNDLWLSRKIGDLHGVEISLRSIANVYIELLQFREAKKLIQESLKIGEQLNDEVIIKMANYHLSIINNFLREAGKDRIQFGPTALCMCESGSNFEDCCGIADHDPVDLPFQIPGSTEFIENEAYRFAKRPEEINRLDFIFRDSPDSYRRHAWATYEFKKGWFEMYELPDMANSYLLSAKSMLNNLPEDYAFTDIPLSCLIMSVSALEAFINQVSYFFYDARKSHPRFEINLPDEFNVSVIDFQRNLELTLKWQLLGKVICKTNWKPAEILWSEFRNLIYIRNEFIHFKLVDYERVIPPPKPHPIFKKIPKNVKLREVQHAWPTKILTPSFAEWCVKTTESMIQYFKDQYIKEEAINMRND